MLASCNANNITFITFSTFSTHKQSVVRDKETYMHVHVTCGITQGAMTCTMYRCIHVHVVLCYSVRLWVLHVIDASVLSSVAIATS